jgi:hypothetical protein
MVQLESTNIKTLEKIDLDTLKQYAVKDSLI